MKGFTLSRDFFIKLIAVIMVLGLFFGIVFVLLLPSVEKQSVGVALQRLCPEWVARGCTKDAAERELTTDYEGDTLYLYNLCLLDFGAGPNEISQWDKVGGAYDHCLQQCIGCPR